MKLSKLFYVLNITIAIIIVGCANFTPNTEYSSQVNIKPEKTNLLVPPELTAPNINETYKKIESQIKDSQYQLAKIFNMRIEQGGSQRWLVVENTNVDDVWPKMITYLTELGLTVKYQNQVIGSVQTDWSTRNSNVSQTGIRSFFEWIGWGEIYNMPTQYMFKITLWQNNKNVQIFVTDIQMSEVFPGCGKVLNSTIETSDRQITRWMALPPNPQLELDFLMQFMAFYGLPSEKNIKVDSSIVTNSTNANKSQALDTSIQNHQIILNDEFDRSWWRVALALDRIGLGVSDKDRTRGEYYVYPMQSEVRAPEDGFFSKLFKTGNGQTLKVPDAEYIVKLTTNDTKTVINITTLNKLQDSALLNKYINDLNKQLK